MNDSMLSLSPDIAFAEDTSDSAPTLRDLIARRAYELFERRGRREGHALEDWLEAEREVRHHFAGSSRQIR